MAFQSLSIHEERRRSVNSGPFATRDVVEDVLSKAVLVEGRLDLIDFQLEPPRHRRQVLRRELLAAG